MARAYRRLKRLLQPHRRRRDALLEKVESRKSESRNQRLAAEHGSFNLTI